ncbi:hypothetical protein XFF6166_850001 [Xanthomonas citri pv. fuscans]|nr:hypothetical protein XFF6166_850001 [Xanthomonas citri pv. fuscans]SOO04460.1 hypothetical protein XFF6960_990006 [Xanthomonas citri pv. fuscans]SOO13179.1 hypothetical protein XFF7766_1220005 [Xanthomonas citri pv. fuscans]SOO46053.1 hypothetical protein XFF1815_950002 [Xanthomonas citri pv. fuscans]
MDPNTPNILLCNRHRHIYYNHFLPAL